MYVGTYVPMTPLRMAQTGAWASFHSHGTRVMDWSLENQVVKYPLAIHRRPALGYDFPALFNPWASKMLGAG